MLRSFESKVVGVSFVPGYPNHVFRLNDLAVDRFLSAPGEFGDYRGGDPEHIPVDLVRNPDNEHDPNAIEVHAPALGDNDMIGHLPRAVAARLAPSIDAGDSWRAEITHVAVDPDHPGNPGITVKIDRNESNEPF